MDAPRRLPFRRILPLAALAALLTVTGCLSGGESDDATTTDATISTYIKNYGTDYSLTRRLESGTLYEEYTWYAKGLRVTAVYETGDVLREERFTVGSSSWSPAR